MAEQNQITRALLANPNRKPGKPNWEVGPGGFASQEEIEAMTMAREKTPQTRQELAFKHYQYWAPFNYPNVRVEIGPGGEFNMDGVELDVPPLGAITIVEDEPIVGVTVIGSACAPPGYVMVHGEPLVWKYPRSGVKMMVDGLWGEHLNAPLWAAGIKEDWREAGLSSAAFALPESKKVTIMGGSQTVIGVGEMDLNTHDGHYCFRVIRVTVGSS